MTGIPIEEGQKRQRDLRLMIQLKKKAYLALGGINGNEAAPIKQSRIQDNSELPLDIIFNRIIHHKHK